MASLPRGGMETGDQIALGAIVGGIVWGGPVGWGIAFLGALGCHSDAGGHDANREDSAVRPDASGDGINGDVGKPENIACGMNTCKPQTEVCCVDTLSEPVCIGAQNACGGATVACDGPEDCTDAVCCAALTFSIDVVRRQGELNGETECTPSCNFSFDYNPLTGHGEVTARACHDARDCTVTEPVCCETPGIETGICLTTSAAMLAEEETYGLMDCN